MKIADLIFSVKAEIDKVSKAEIIHRLNLFFQTHKVSDMKKIVLEEDTYHLMLDSNNVYIKELFVNNKKINPGLTREEFLSEKSSDKMQFNVFPELQVGKIIPPSDPEEPEEPEEPEFPKLKTPIFTPAGGHYSSAVLVTISIEQGVSDGTETEDRSGKKSLDIPDCSAGIIGFNFALKKGDTVLIYRDIYHDNVSLDTEEYKAIPYPDKYEYAITCFVLKELFKSYKYLNPDMFSYYNQEYQAQMRIIRQTPATSFIKKLGDM